MLADMDYTLSTTLPTSYDETVGAVVDDARERLVAALASLVA